MSRHRIIDLTDSDGFGLLPPCADPSFDHRTCDYWEDADRGSKAHRASWLSAGSGPSAGGDAGSGRHPAPGHAVGTHARPGNPFAPAPRVFDNPFADIEPSAGNPFLPGPRRVPANPFALDDDEETADNPFAPKRTPSSGPVTGPRKLGLLTRGLAVFGSYAKLLLVQDDDAEGGERAVAYAQFGPLSAYPRALRLRDLYPALPQAPLPAVITCIATTADARRAGLARQLVAAVCDDLAGRGFAAVEAYPEARAKAEATSAATPAFWIAAGFRVVVDDERFPVVRREL